MTHHKLTPDVPGEIGDDTELDRSVHPPRVLHLAYVIDNWLGDDLLEAYPAFMVTDHLRGLLEGSGLSGYEIRQADVTIEEEARDTLPMIGRTEFPEFLWLHVTGKPGHDDFGLTAKGDLVVSDRALEVLRQGHIDRCDIDEYDQSTGA
ncbi:hypothetical protein [Saccharopolyspora endophytica]|uniref:Uncharacterized protein n=1 Tax=Saccharopolyspora endophytica TaxID=543886 RepID=A0ABS5DK48_9PSEU|nr:hypothetical protein [Saccharopolyspora endophytica]MBQ0926659.1 hypothetical protein [Saccharopolyspora endophytica]